MVRGLTFRTASWVTRRRKWWPEAIAVSIAAGIFAAVAFWSRASYVELGEPAVWTGYILFILIAALTLFSARKRLSMVPLIRARWWTLFHVTAGVLALGVFGIHAVDLWPAGSYERWLALLFYLTSASGIIGFMFTRIYPRRLTETGLEIIYERIPHELARMRDETESIVLECARETGSDTLPRYYVETLDWYMRRPRFQLNCLWGGRRGTNWVNRQSEIVRRYLGKQEIPYLDRLSEIMRVKNRVDFHHAVQSLLKGWLLVHVPLAMALLVLSVWHLIVVHVYFL